MLSKIFSKTHKNLKFSENLSNSFFLFYFMKFLWGLIEAPPKIFYSRHIRYPEGASKLAGERGYKEKAEFNSDWTFFQPIICRGPFSELRSQERREVP